MENALTCATIPVQSRPPPSLLRDEDPAPRDRFEITGSKNPVNEELDDYSLDAENFNKRPLGSNPSSPKHSLGLPNQQDDPQLMEKGKERERESERERE